MCWDCGQNDHWAGDAGCKNPGAGLFKPSPKPAGAGRPAAGAARGAAAREGDCGGGRGGPRGGGSRQVRISDQVDAQLPEEYDIGTDDEGAYNDTQVAEHSGDAAHETLATAAWSEVPDPFAEEEASRALIEDIFKGESIEFELDLGDAAGSAGFERGSMGSRGNGQRIFRCR